MDEHSFSQYEPVPYLLQNALQTDIPLIYLNKKPEIKPELPTVFMLIGPSGSGKDSISDPLYKEGLIVRATTATSRKRRIEEDEPEERHIWMRQKKEEETIEEYDHHLVEEYTLIEHDRHFGELYGLPLSSLEKAAQQGLPLIRSEIRGVRTLLKYLDGKMNCIVVFIVAESFSQIWKRISDRENILERQQKSIDEIREAPEVTNFYLYNPELVNSNPGLPQAQEALRQLVMLYSQHE